ncbi:hypothetical protein KAU40_02915, partial [Candidatus Parcubacteria bacterium]|nr:hypothetical protein [Candidatus Parcubacteria bacterium]
KPKLARKTFEEFLNKNNLNLVKSGTGLIPQGLIIPKNSFITLCGDAAGLTKPWSGGGVIWGLTAADILLKNFPDFLKYKKEIKKFFLLQIIFSKIIKKVVYFLGFKTPWLLPKKYTIDGDFLFRRRKYSAVSGDESRRMNLPEGIPRPNGRGSSLF